MNFFELLKETLVQDNADVKQAEDADVLIAISVIPFDAEYEK